MRAQRRRSGKHEVSCDTGLPSCPHSSMNVSHYLGSPACRDNGLGGEKQQPQEPAATLECHKSGRKTGTLSRCTRTVNE